MTGVIGKASATSSGASSHTSSHTSSKSHSYDHDHDHEHGYEYGKPVVVVSKPEWCGNRERVNHSDQMRVVCKYRKMDYSQHYEKRSVAFLTHLNSNLLINIDVLSMNIHSYIRNWRMKTLDACRMRKIIAPMDPKWVCSHAMRFCGYICAYIITE